jgi:hypothetical protein
MPDLADHYRTSEAAELLEQFLPRPVVPADAIPILRAASVPELRIGGALLWRRDAVDALVANLRCSRARAEDGGRR